MPNCRKYLTGSKELSVGLAKRRDYKFPETSSTPSFVGTMTFADILDNVGGMGRFQMMMVTFLAIPLMMLASQNLLQNFTAGIPRHHCQIRVVSNATRQGNGTVGNLGVDQLLRISIPMDMNRHPEQCRRFVAPQWRLLDPNASLGNQTVFDTEACEDGWTYDRSLFSNTIVSEVRKKLFLSI